MMVLIGIDHGINGGLAALDESGKILSTLKMPTMKVDGEKQINCFQVYSWLYENFGDYEHEVTACGERLHAIFKASASTTFSFGKNIGKIVGIIECLEMEYYEVRAVQWQKFIFETFEIPETHAKKKTPSGKLKTDTKVMAKAAVAKIWELDALDYMDHDGICDALLIAKFAQLTSKEVRTANQVSSRTLT